MDFDFVFEDELTEYERLREKNKKELEAMMSDFTEDINQSIATINNYKAVIVPRAKRKRETKDSSFTSSVVIPLERRRSDRLLHVTPRYSYRDLVDEEDIESHKSYSDTVDDLEKVIFRRKPAVSRKSVAVPYVPVEEITNKYLENIATHVYKKTYCPKNGTSCHQCRQKTLDSKTYCRSGHCVGVRGQFCGVCLKNRYGEDIKNALLNHNWECPPCRGLCNCSICRTREGKRPTGILAPLAFQYGHKSVKDFLLSLNGKYDYESESVHQEKGLDKAHNKHNRVYKDSNQFLIGFNQVLKPVWIVERKWLASNDVEGHLLGFSESGESVMIKI